MSLYAVGDLQGCLEPLDRLLAQLPSDARLVFVGDLINRGPDSLGTLRRVMALGDRAIALLGNHDLHFLAVAAGIRPPHAEDTLHDILDAPDRDELIRWLRHRPLAHTENGALFVHAGILPAWSHTKALSLASEVEQELRGDQFEHFLHNMYGNQPLAWSEALVGPARWRCILNAMTRMRYVSDQGEMDLKHKGSPLKAPPGYHPWYLHPQRAWAGQTVIFGHWSTAGLVQRADAIGIDTGCVWGGALTAVLWPERQFIQLPCPQVRVPFAD
jgi:bis(5'-nucleosyl)-tetraphosphatase (symmetrical)